jgi:hypothetical protein
MILVLALQSDHSFCTYVLPVSPCPPCVQYPCVDASKLDFVLGLVAMSIANHIENALTSLWFVGYSKRTPDALSLVWFWMKQSQRRGAAILFKMLVN